MTAARQVAPLDAGHVHIVMEQIDTDKAGPFLRPDSLAGACWASPVTGMVLLF